MTILDYDSKDRNRVDSDAAHQTIQKVVKLKSLAGSSCDIVPLGK